MNKHGCLIIIIIILICFVILQLSAELMGLADWDARVSHMISTLVSAGVTTAEADTILRRAVTSFFRKLYIADNYQPASALRASTRVTLVRAKDNVSQVESLGEDYGVGAVCDGPVDVHVLQGTHESFVVDAETSTQLARLFDTVLSG